jgi:methionyl aminopeptidase
VVEVARLVQRNVEGNRFAVVREFVGHGIGRQMHEDPKVPNFVTGEGCGATSSCGRA